MSISPKRSQPQHSSSSSPSVSSSQNPNSLHGSSHSVHHQLSFDSLTISAPHSPSSSLTPNQLPGQVATAAHISTESSNQKVNELGQRRGHEPSSHRDIERNSLAGSGCPRSRSKGKKMSEVRDRGRSNTVSGNHLLNFQYDPIVRSQTRVSLPPSKRQYKRKPYNKDLFLQANYKFVVLDRGNYAPESMDPDKMLVWEDIVCVRYSTPLPVQCPICLEHPLCPQITSCGHIFCFPCILCYLLMGEENENGDCFKRCPLCFIMVSPKDLYTIYIENVKLYSVRDSIEFTLLTREKDSFVLSRKYKQDGITDPFSKFMFTSDGDLSVREAISELDRWLAKADSGLVDDLEKLPYVCVAMEQLEQRKKYWNEHRNCDITGSQGKSDELGSILTLDASCFDNHGKQSRNSNGQTMFSAELIEGKANKEIGFSTSSDEARSLESSSEQESTSLQRLQNKRELAKDKDSYSFYQAVDGQHIILDPLNMKCLLTHYGSYDMLPSRISGRILELETLTQSEVLRRRYPYLSHFSLTTTFQLCEIDLSESLSTDSLEPFMDEIKKRERHRKQLARKEEKEKIKAEVAAAAGFLPAMYTYGQSTRNDFPPFSMDDFEALGNASTISPNQPIAGERNLFSNVARLGYAAGHDSPVLKMENVLRNSSTDSPASSFANVICRERITQGLEPPKKNEMGKKGKKSARVLLSTAGGRRY